MDPEEAVSLHLKNYGKADKILIGVSGGVDSKVLALAAKNQGLNFDMCVVDHQLQEISSKVAEEVLLFAKDLGVDASVVKVNVSLDTGRGMEDAARDARLNALTLEAKKVGASQVWLGHNRNDQAETLLTRLSRGSSIKSLGGIKEVRDIFHRPLLHSSREEVVNYAKNHNIKYWTDPHNSSDEYQRVRVRKALSMLSELLETNLVDTLPRLAQQAQRDSKYLESVSQEAYKKSVLDTNTVHLPKHLFIENVILVLSNKTCQGLDKAILSRVVVLALANSGANMSRVTAEHVSGVEDMVFGKTQGILQLPGKLNVTRSDKKLFFYKNR